MLSQIAAGFRLQQGHQITDLDEELIFSPLLGRKRAGVALGGESLDATAHHLIAPQRDDLLCGSGRQTSAQRLGVQQVTNLDAVVQIRPVNRVTAGFERPVGALLRGGFGQPLQPRNSNERQADFSAIVEPDV